MIKEKAMLKDVVAGAMVSCCTLLHAAPAAAQREGQAAVLEEIVVMAQKREQSLQDVPLSLQTFAGRDVVSWGINDVEALSERMPGITLSRTGTSQRIIIRGIGSGTNDGFEQSVGTFVDGVYYGRGQQIRPDFIDVARIEALKGPQSTLFGTNVTAGAIVVTTNDPTDQAEGRISLLAGEYNRREAEAVLSGPLTDKLSGRLALYRRDFEGFMKNVSLQDWVAGDESVGGRLVLKYRPTDQLTIRGAYEHHDIDQNGHTGQQFHDPTAANAAFALTGDPGIVDYRRIGGFQQSYGVIPNGPDYDRNAFNTASIRVSHESAAGSFTSITGYTDYDWDNSNDADYIVSDTLSFAQRTLQKFDQLSQEFRWESSINDSFDYLLGFYYHRQTLETTKITEVPAFGALVVSPAEQDTETWALFLQGTYDITERTRLTAGLRYGSDEKEVEEQLSHTLPGLFGAFPHDISAQRHDRNMPWLVRIENDLNDDVMLYASVTQGYKAGGFDLNGLGSSMGNTPSENFEYEDEKATSFEAGIKSTWLSGAANLNLNAFYTNYESLQVTQFTGFAFDVGNAAEATVLGLELDARYALTERLQASATVAWQDFEFDEYGGAACNLRQKAGLQAGCTNDTQDLGGATGQFAPDLSVNLELQYERPVSDTLLLRGRLNAIYSDEYYTQLGLDPNTLQDSYTKFDARVALASRSGRWEVAVIGSNLTDEVVRVNSFDTPLSTFGLPLTYINFVLPPRTFAAQATFSF